MSLPDQQPPGSKQYELRATASGDTLDELLVAFTAPAERKRLPGFLHLFGNEPYVHTVDDMFNGESQKDRALKAYRRHVADRVRNKFSLDTKVGHDPINDGVPLTRLNLGVNLGIETARRLLVPPFVEGANRNDTVLPMVYTIPSPVDGQDMIRALVDLSDYLGDRPRGVVDELALVETKVRDRPIILRSRVRETPVQEPPAAGGPNLQKAS